MGKILNEVLNKHKSKLTIGPNLVARISPSTANFRDFLSQTTQTPLEFQPPAADELKATVHNFNCYRASGVDNIPMRIIKLGIDIVVEPLTEIINLSLGYLAI